MSVNVETTMRWSELNRDMSWEKLLNLEDILPKVGLIYPITIHPYHLLKAGRASLLWKPPHSDINGWYDNRPWEIMKSYVLHGSLQHHRQETSKFDFVIESRIKLVELFLQLDAEKTSPLAELEQAVEECVWVAKASVDKYVYVHASWEYNFLELILSYQNSRLWIHYIESYCEYSSRSATIIKYMATHAEKTLIEKLFVKANELVDNSTDRLPGNMVFGAEYQ